MWWKVPRPMFTESQVAPNKLRDEANTLFLQGLRLEPCTVIGQLSWLFGAGIKSKCFFFFTVQVHPFDQSHLWNDYLCVFRVCVSVVL